MYGLVEYTLLNDRSLLTCDDFQQCGIFISVDSDESV